MSASGTQKLSFPRGCVQLSETYVGLVLSGSQIVDCRSPVLKHCSFEHMEK
jgi:hypothetical protein